MRKRKKEKGKRKKEKAVLQLVFLFTSLSSPQLPIIFMVAGMLLFNYTAAQQSTIKKTDKIETIEGKKFYLHPVEKGQTLYSIAKTYGTTVDIVLSNNPGAIDGLKTGQHLKIPFLGNTEAIKKEIAKNGNEEKHTAKKKSIKTSSDSTRKHRTDIDLKNAINTLSKNQKKDSVIITDNIKPIGDIHVALLLPLSLKTVDRIEVQKVARGDEKIPDETKIGIEFYEGMKLAFDSLRKQGFAGYLHIYDSTHDSLGFDKLMKQPELKEMDLIICLLQGKRFEAVLKFAKANNINIVSPLLLGNNMLLGNPNASKITPSYVTQAEELAKYTAENFSGQNIIVFNSASTKDKPYLNTFKRTANPILKKANADTVKEITFTTLKTFISKTKPNIIVIPSTNQSFVTEAINKLFLSQQENKDSIIVLGMSNFEDMESLDFGYLNSLHTIISSHTFADYNNTQTKNFILKYRQEFKTEPTHYVFSGFDAGYYYLSGLQKHGNALQRKLPELKQKGIQTEFNFYQSDMNSGYENRGVGIIKFENYSYTRVK